MDFKELLKPLPIESIDFRIQSINNGGYATILAYKDARVDMQRLDNVVGCTNWKREHTRDNKNCIVSIWDEDKKQWVSKEDVGVESNSEAEKGLASDSFKRACFNWGIGRELYDYPIISIQLNKNELQETGKTSPKYKPSYNLKLKEWKWYSEFDDNNKLIKLHCIDQKGDKRFTYPEEKTTTINKQQHKLEEKATDRMPALTLDGFNYLITKGTKEEIIQALNGRRMSGDQRTELTKILAKNG